MSKCYIVTTLLFSLSLSILLPFSTFFKWQNFGAAAAEKFKVAKRQNSFQSDALVLLSLSLMYLVIVKVVDAISKCVLVVESLNELKVQVTYYKHQNIFYKKITYM